MIWTMITILINYDNSILRIFRPRNIAKEKHELISHWAYCNEYFCMHKYIQTACLTIFWRKNQLFRFIRWKCFETKEKKSSLFGDIRRVWHNISLHENSDGNKPCLSSGKMLYCLLKVHVRMKTNAAIFIHQGFSLKMTF